MSFMFFCPSDISHFHSFDCPLGSQLGSLLQKCDPDRCAQNSHGSRLCFFIHQTVSIFIPVVFPWGPNLGPCCKCVILTSARETCRKVVCAFLTIGHFHFHSFGCHLGFQFGSLQQKCNPDGCSQNPYKSRLCFLTHQTFSMFVPLAVPRRPNLDPCGKSVILAGTLSNRIKIVYVLSSIRHFPFSFLLAVP